MAYERQPITITVGGETYSLHLTFNGLCRMEDELSTPSREYTWHQAITAAERGNARGMRAVFFAALVSHHPEMTMAKAGELIDQIGIANLSAQLQQVAATAHPDDRDVAELNQGGEPARPRKAQSRLNGTGERSISRPGRPA